MAGVVEFPESAKNEDDKGTFAPEPGEFPMHALNPVLRELAEQSAGVYQIKPELPGMAGVATLAGACGKAFVVSGAANGRETHCNLFVIPGAPKSYGKGSAAMMAAPLREASEEMAGAFRKGGRPQLVTEQRILEKREKGLVDQCAGLGKGKGKLTESEREATQTEIVRIRRRLDEIAPLDDGRKGVLDERIGSAPQ